MQLAAESREPVDLHAALQLRMEYVLDRRRLPEVQVPVAEDGLPQLP
jgi:hypothetical protein